VTRLHERGVKLLNERSNHIHVFNSVIEGLECLVVLDFFVLSKVRCCLASLHVLEKLLKIVSINVVPKGCFPGLKLTINDRDQIPHLLKLTQLILTVNKLLLLCSLQFKELFKDLKLLGFILHGAGLVIVLRNLIIGFINYFLSHLSLTVGQCAQELLSKVEHLDLELSNALLHVVRLLRLKGQDCFFDSTEGVIGSVVQVSLRVLNGDEKVDSL